MVRIPVREVRADNVVQTFLSDEQALVHASRRSRFGEVTITWADSMQAVGRDGRFECTGFAPSGDRRAESPST